MTEDDIYRTSTQYRLWSFTPETLASLRATTNAAAAKGVKDAYYTPPLGNEQVGGDAAVADVDCLTVEEERKIVGYYCLRTLDFVDFCEYPTNVKVNSPALWSSREAHVNDELHRRPLPNTSSASI